MLETVPGRTSDSKESQFPVQPSMYGEKKGWQLVNACCHILLINSAIWGRMKSQTYAFTGKCFWVEQGVRPVGKHMVQSTVFVLPPVFVTQPDICNMIQEVMSFGFYKPTL